MEHLSLLAKADQLTPDFCEKRWAWLDRYRPQAGSLVPVPLTNMLSESGGQSRTNEASWVETSRVVNGGGYDPQRAEESTWGIFSYRRESLELLLQVARDAQGRWPFQPLHLHGINTVSHGVLYEVGMDGNHRLAILKALDVPYLKADVEIDDFPNQLTTQSGEAIQCWARFLSCGHLDGSTLRDGDWTTLTLDPSTRYPWLALNPADSYRYARAIWRVDPSAFGELALPAGALTHYDTWHAWTLSNPDQLSQARPL